MPKKIRTRPIPDKIAQHLYDLADAVEQHGAAILESSDEFPFSYTKARVYYNHYESLRRIEQMESIFEKLYPPESPYFGWGPMAFHEADVPEPPDLPRYMPDMSAERKKQILELRRKVPGQLIVRKRNHPCPNDAMWIMRGVAGKVQVTGVSEDKLVARLRRLTHQTYTMRPRPWTPWLLEALQKLAIKTSADGSVWIGVEKFRIRPLKPVDNPDP